MREAQLDSGVDPVPPAHLPGGPAAKVREQRDPGGHPGPEARRQGPSTPTDSVPEAHPSRGRQLKNITTPGDAVFTEMPREIEPLGPEIGAVVLDATSLTTVLGTGWVVLQLRRSSAVLA